MPTDPPAAMDGPTMQETALALAGRGFHIFPLAEGGKLPAIPGWHNKATRDHDRIRSWWPDTKDPVTGNVYPSRRNIGIATGKYKDDQHLLVIDVDMKNGTDGELSLCGLAVDHLDTDMATTEVRTPTGGRHLYFVTKEPSANTVGKLGAGLDTRGDRGFVVAPGSTIDGKPYTLARDIPPKPAAKWIVDRIGKPTPQDDKIVTDVFDDSPANQQRAIDFLEQRAPAIEGQGGDFHTLVTAMRVGDLGISKLVCLELLAEHWNDRCDPPWSFEELARKVENGEAYRKKAIGTNNPETDFDEIEATTQGKAPLPLEKFGHISVRFDRNHLVKGWLDRETLALLYGDSGSGKTFICMSVCYAIATGREWAGCKTTRGAVLYAATEAGNSARKRLLALEKHHKVKDAPIWLIPSPLNLLSNTADTRALIETANGLPEPVALIVIDTLSRALHGGNENSSEDMGAIVKNLDRIRNATGATVLVVHHTGKNQAKGARGHSLLRAALDTEMELSNNIIRSTKERDWDPPKPVPFSLEQVQIGRDDEDNPVTSAVAIVGQALAEDDFSDFDFNPNERMAMDAILAALEDGHALEGEICCSLSEWQLRYAQVYCQRNGMGWIDGAERIREGVDDLEKVKTIQRQFNRARDGLVKKGNVREVASTQWTLA